MKLTGIYILVLITIIYSSLSKGEVSYENEDLLTIAISENTLEEILIALVGKEVPLDSPDGASVKINSIDLDINKDVTSLVLVGDMLEKSGEAVPVQGVFSIDYQIKGNKLNVIPSIVHISPRYKDISILSIEKLIKAFLLDNIVFTDLPIEPFSLPIQTELSINNSERSFRIKERIGMATVDFVTTINLSPSQVKLQIIDIQQYDEMLIVSAVSDIHGSAQYKDDKTSFYPGHVVENGVELFIGGQILADIMNSNLASVNLPFYLENAQGWLDGENLGMSWGSRKEWHVIFSGDRPLTGELNIHTKYTWTDHLMFNSQLSMNASGRIHGHYDPGPGGGCGADTGIRLQGQTPLNGRIKFSQDSRDLLVELNTLTKTTGSLQYATGTVSLCGLGVKGPFTGSVNDDIPVGFLHSMRLPIEPLQGILGQAANIESRLQSLSQLSDGMHMKYDVKIIR